MMIPPHAARLAGSWAEQTTRRAPDVAQVRRDRARRITVARVLTPCTGLNPRPARRASEPRTR